MLSIVMPVCGVEDATNACIDNLQQFARGDLDIIVVDNASGTPYSRDNVTTIRNESNIGFWPAMLQGIETAKSNIILCMHNDVFVWEQNFDSRILAHFARDFKLGMAGFFGGRGLGLDGGRGHPEGNMIAKKYGTPQNVHGHWQTTTHPAVIFDSLSMIFDRRKLYSIDYKNIPPHHWTDRIVCLRMALAGFHLATIGIAFDHGGGFTSGSKTMSGFTEDWCREHNLDMRENWDMTLYMYGLAQFQEEFIKAFGTEVNQLWVHDGYEYEVRKA